MANCSIIFSALLRFMEASSTRRAIFATAESSADAVTVHSMYPVRFVVPALTKSPGDLFTGAASPVRMLSSTLLTPRTTCTSTGTFVPGLMATRSPMESSSTPTIFPPTSSASSGASAITSASAARLRARARCSSISLAPKRNATAAASVNSCSASAPAMASSMSMLISMTSSRMASTALYAMDGSASATDPNANHLRCSAPGM
mmetsp:Transcript_6976/g.18063  ORF Transcript_6976/g.18063 Transcript_6976/m.18063 type:complete len:204 (-) Transcript_6976:781-1392(-)